MISNKEKEEGLLIINTSTRESLQIVKDTDMEYTHMIVATNTKGNGRMIINMEKESGCLKTGQGEKGHSKTTKKMERVSSHSKMELKKNRFGKMA